MTSTSSTRSRSTTSILTTCSSSILLSTFVLSLLFVPIRSFCPVPHHSHASSKCALYGLSDWRKLSTSKHSGDAVPTFSQEDPTFPATSLSKPPVTRNFLPVTILTQQSPCQEILLPGDVTYLQLVDDDEVRLFQQAQDVHGGIFGIGVLQEEISGEKERSMHLWDVITLLAIKDYRMMEDQIGIFVTAQVVGRGRIHELVLPRNLSSSRRDEAQQTL